jgi:cobalt-zinc-cadmium efflux system protein
MDDDHRGSRLAGQRALALALAITLSLLITEVIGGILTNSLALLADAGHMLSDVAALGMSMFAIWMALRPASPTRTYGFHRVEILAALANGVALVLIALFVFWQAAQRLQDPPDVSSLPMLAVATAGLGANLTSGAILFRHRRRNLNLRGAFLHVATDALGSMGAISAGIVMLATGWYLADPIVSVFIAALILVSSWRLLRESVGILLEAVPRHVDIGQLESDLTTVPGVEAVHDLHVWTVTSGFVALSCHCEMDEHRDTHQVLADLFRLIHDRYGIRHVTIQPELKTLHSEHSAHSLPRCTSEIGYEDFGLSGPPLPEGASRGRGDDGGS